MKIHGSMNVLLHKLRNHLPLLLCMMFSCFLAGNVSFGQSPTLKVLDLTVMKNDTLHFEFEDHHAFVPPKILRQGGAVNSISQFQETNSINGTANNINTIEYIPANGFVGRDTLEVRYHIEGPGYIPQQAYLVLNIAVVPSNITAMPDYVATVEGQSIDIDVLVNDYGNGTNQTIAEVTNKNRGDAELINNDTQVRFTPATGFVGLSHFNYSICDAQGACDMTTVSICVMPANPPAYDSIAVQTKQEDPQVILMALDSNYTVITAPTNGVATDTGDVWTYIPNAGFNGIDKVIYEDATNNRIRVFQIDVIGPAPYESIFLQNDLVFTPEDEEVSEIHLLSNDNGGSYMIGVSRINEWGAGDTEQGGTLVYLPSIGKGVYKYIPPTGFSGVDRFRYKASIPGGGLTDTATCYIVVDDLKPVLPVYDLVVPENTPLVIGDILPFDAYDYQVVSNPSNGTLIYYPGFATHNSAYGQEVSGYNMLVYEPNNNATGSDNFEVEYCAAYGNDCQLVKVELDIVTINAPQGDTLCVGRNCVWPGDTDHNGVVDINDLLPIGLAMGDVGPTRTAGSNEWYAQSGENWNSLYINGLGYDVKNIDTDGNGIISSMDTTAISQYFGKYNNIVPASHAPISELPFYPGSFPGPPQPGDVILIPLNLGNSSTPAFDAYGLSFNVDYDPALFESVKVIWNDDAWMNYNSPILSMDHKPYPGRLEAGYTRTSGLAATGQGVIGVLEFIVIDDFNGFRPTEDFSTINISANYMNSSGQNNNLGDHSITFSLGMNEEGEVAESTDDLSSNLLVYPNPSKDIVNIHLNGNDNLMERIAIYNIVGSQIYNSGTILAKRTNVTVSDLNPGVYILKVWSNGEILTKKIEILK